MTMVDLVGLVFSLSCPIGRLGVLIGAFAEEPTLGVLQFVFSPFFILPS